MKQRTLCLCCLVLALVVLALPAFAGQITGAIFTTKIDGLEVNFNIYADKGDVYLNGGPGKGSPPTAAGLPDGVYVFMVTDPSGKILLSTDPAACRRVQVTNGIFGALVNSPTPCPVPFVLHMQGAVGNDGTTVQLMPYNDTLTTVASTRPG